MTPFPSYLWQTILQFASFALLFSAWWIALARVQRKSIATVVVAGSFLILLAQAVYMVSDVYTGAGINESSLFQLQYGTEGTRLAVIWPALRIVFCIGAIFVVSSALVFWCVARRAKTCQKEGLTIKTLRKRVGVLIGLLALGLGIHPAVIQIAVLLAPSPTQKQLEAVLKKAVIAKAPASLPAEPKSLVHIYLESFEGTFDDPAIFPHLTPNMRRLNKTALTFQGIHQVPFTGWTIAGQAATNCGYPAITGISVLYRERDRRPCVTDMLAALGYHQVYMNGASLRFTEKGAFMLSHGYNEVYGTKGVEKIAGYKGPLSEWGDYDTTLFKAAKITFRRLVKKGKPFNLTLLTLDTHPPHGFPALSCPKDFKVPPSRAMLRSVHCSDAELGRFIDWLLKNKPENVVVVVQNDHLMVNLPDTKGLLWPKTKDGTHRHDRLMIWGAGSPRVVRRKATMFDVGPTIMHVLGWPGKAIGFGRDLLSPQPTLVETKGYPWMRKTMFDLLSLPGFEGDKVANATRPLSAGMKPDDNQCVYYCK